MDNQNNQNQTPTQKYYEQCSEQQTPSNQEHPEVSQHSNQNYPYFQGYHPHQYYHPYYQQNFMPPPPPPPHYFEQTDSQNQYQNFPPPPPPHFFPGNFEENNIDSYRGGRGRGRGWGRGRGKAKFWKQFCEGHEQFWKEKKKNCQGKNENWKEFCSGKEQLWKGKKKFCKKWSEKLQEKEDKANVKVSSSSSESESEDQDVKQISKKLDSLSMKDKKNSKNEAYEEFQESLIPVFHQFSVCAKHKRRIIKYLAKRYESPQDLEPLLQTLAELERESPHYFENPGHLNFSRIIKEIIKKGFEIKKINAKLDKILFLKAKKENKDMQNERFNNRQKIPFLNYEELEELNHQNFVFLFDGNNIMVTNKIFRNYFLSQQAEENLEGQVRLQWLLGETLTAELFFDTKFDDYLYEGIRESILSPQQYPVLEKVPLYFADKHIDPKATADQKILWRLQEIQNNKEYEGKQIILVSADRELGHLCREICAIKKTSGRYIFKYCKHLLRQLNYDHPERKGIIKRIFTY